MEGTKRPLIAKSGRTEKILVATCTSSNGKPPSTVTWDTKLKGEAEFQEIRNSNGTITVISRYRLVPSREAHRQQLMCVVNYQLERFTDSITLNVQCKRPGHSWEGSLLGAGWGIRSGRRGVCEGRCRAAEGLLSCF